MRLINCAGIGSLYISHKKTDYTRYAMRTDLIGWNSRTVRKSKESTVKTNQDKNKNRVRVRKVHLHR